MLSAFAGRYQSGFSLLGMEDREDQGTLTDLPSVHICLLGCLILWYNHNNARIML